jgi:hypothetical protein
MSELRPETCARLAASMASCLATLSEANRSDGYHITPTPDSDWGWTYAWSH